MNNKNNKSGTEKKRGERERERTSAKVDADVEQEHGVADQIEEQQAHVAPVVVEERDGDGQYDDVGDEQDEHDEVPVEAKARARMYDPVADLLLAHLLLEHALAAAEQLHRQLVVRRLQHAHKVRLEVRVGGPRVRHQIVRRPHARDLVVDERIGGLRRRR